jgi:hypothetical protein
VWNTGVAPFYYDWPVQLAALNRGNVLANTWTAAWTLSSLLPAAANTAWSFTLPDHGLAAGQYRLLLRVRNPLENGVPLRFANTTQDADLQGWLTLGQVSVTSPSTGPSLSGNLSPAGFDLLVSNAAPGAWTLESTSDFAEWTPLLTTNTTSPQWSVICTILPSARFYRVVGAP